MPLVAKVSGVSVVRTEDQVFDFTEGTRQVTQAEADTLTRWSENSPFKVEITETKKGGK